MAKRRKKHVAITKALVGTQLMLNRRPETITVTSEDIPPLVDALKAHGLRIVRIKRRAARKSR